MKGNLIAAALLLLGAGCRQDSGAGNARAADTVPSPPYSVETLPPDSVLPPAPQRELPARPRALADSVLVEGMWQPEQLTLVRAPAGFEPPFTTYLPSGLEVSFNVNDSTPSVRFVAAFAGRVNPAAYLQVRLYPPGSAELVVRSAVDTYLRGLNPREDRVHPTETWPWGLAAWSFQAGGPPADSVMLGRVGIARHGNRFLHVIAHYPAEYADGIGPRFQRILREWRWEDDGARLAPR